MISFCSTCRNRLWQIKQTLQVNLESIGRRNEIVLVDYGSTDGLSGWVWRNFRSYIDDEALVFFEVKNKVSWNVGRAKNLAHRLASGGYLFNLDADNYITSRDVEEIVKAQKLGLHCWQWSQNKRYDGSFGRVGLPTTMFKMVGGYDESFLPMGQQDIDLMNRLVALNHPRLHLNPPEKRAIQNSISDKVREISLHHTASLDQDGLFNFCDQVNSQISKFRMFHEGPIRHGGGLSYKGLLNGRSVFIDGFDEITYLPE